MDKWLKKAIMEMWKAGHTVDAIVQWFELPWELVFNFIHNQEV